MKGAKTDTAKLGMSVALARDREIAQNTPKNIMPNIEGASIRHKKIGGLVYYYLVKHYWHEGKSHQKVLRYFGLRPPRAARIKARGSSTGVY